MNTRITLAVLGLLGTGLSSLASAADTQAESTARSLHRRHADSVVVVRLTVAVTVTPGDQPAQSSDRTFEQTGTVVSADGRVLLAASSVDPAILMDGRTVNTPVGAMKLSAVSQVKEAFIVLSDGTEVPAKVVLKDRDLNLALVAPVAPGSETFVPVDTSVSEMVEPVDEVVVLGRMDKSFDRCPKVEVDSVAAVVTKPRPLISIHVNTTGCPVFSASGKFVGITSGKVEEPSDRDNGGVEPVVVPAETVRRFLAQASAKVPAGK